MYCGASGPQQVGHQIGIEFHWEGKGIMKELFQVRGKSQGGQVQTEGVRLPTLAHP